MTGVATAVHRLNWGCGMHPEPGWINSDVKDGPGIDLSCDIRAGLPLADDTFDYAVSIHALPEVPYPDLLPALEELRRVLRPGGVLRLALPDADRAIDAYRRRDRDYFVVPDADARSVGAKFVTQLLWYGYSRTLFTYEFAVELLEKAGFVGVERCSYRETRSRFPEIVELDNRESESFFVEARKGEAGGDAMIESSGGTGGTVEVEAVVLEPVAPQLRGRNIERPSPGSAELPLQVSGWVLARETRVERVEVAQGDAILGTADVAVPRPDLETAFPDAGDAGSGGFWTRVDLDPHAADESLAVRAVLADGTPVLLGTVRLAARRQAAPSEPDARRPSPWRRLLRLG